MKEAESRQQALYVHVLRRWNLQLTTVSNGNVRMNMSGMTAGFCKKLKQPHYRPGQALWVSAG